MDLDDEVRLVSRLPSGDALALEQFVETYRRFITSISSCRSLHRSYILN
jgi:hypothetical protein